jgi:predicted nucleotidyltransferase
MTTELLDVSNKLEAGTVAIYRDVAEVTDTLGIDYLVVGASGRDLILGHAYGVEIQRATNDYDFAFEIGELSQYQELRDALFRKGFQQSSQPQRLISPRGVDLDLVPFGDFADEQGNITLPPDHDHNMGVLGFSEALANAQLVRMSHEPKLDVPVVSLPGLVLLKLIAWGDRPRDRRAKDAQDFRYIIDSYLKIPEDVSGIWDELDYLEKYDGDIELVAAQVLGRQTGSIAGEAAFAVVDALVSGEQVDAFIVDMDARFAASPSNSQRLLNAFKQGLRAGALDK